MSARINFQPKKINVVQDIEHFRFFTEANVAMLTTMHGALSEIAKCETAPTRNIAETALAEVQKIADRLEVQNA